MQSEVSGRNIVLAETILQRVVSRHFHERNDFSKGLRHTSVFDIFRLYLGDGG